MAGHRPFNEIKRGDDADPAYRAKVDAHKAAIRAEEDEMARHEHTVTFPLGPDGLGNGPKLGELFPTGLGTVGRVTAIRELPVIVWEGVEIPQWEVDVLIWWDEESSEARPS